ncbi:MAG: tRNA lysidine(34) synthetase TilS [Clostridia bacterium]|nr:tRNA lysidine(34) synthetase TilS [Clostridia bacterium]
MTSKIGRAINEYRMFSQGDRVAVGFSGGADSVALLHHLHTNSEAYGITVSAVHIHHMIRGDEADGDLDFCRRFCSERDIPFSFEKIDVPSISREEGIGLEEAGRRERYRVFGGLCENGTDKIALAHHADDCIETVIFNLIRGTGPKGIRGIPPVRDGIVRPLIYCTKDDILEYCRENRLDFVTDSTNYENDCPRNLIRNAVIPELKKINPSAAETVMRTCALIRSDEEYFEKEISGIPDGASRRTLAGLPDPLLSRYLIRKISEETGREPERVHTAVCMKNIRCGNEYKEAPLPGDHVAVCDRDRFFIRKKQSLSEKGADKKSDMIKIHPDIAEYSLDRHTQLVIISYEKMYIIKAAERYGVPAEDIVTLERYSGELYIRKRRNGDTVRSKNMTKKLKELMRASGVPCEKRDTLPILCDGKGILWVPGVVRADRPASDVNNNIYILFKDNIDFNE